MKTVFKFKEVMQLYRCNNYTQFDRLRIKRISLERTKVSAININASLFTGCSIELIAANPE